MALHFHPTAGDPSKTFLAKIDNVWDFVSTATGSTADTLYASISRCSGAIFVGVSADAVQAQAFAEDASGYCYTGVIAVSKSGDMAVAIDAGGAAGLIDSFNKRLGMDRGDKHGLIWHLAMTLGLFPDGYSVYAVPAAAVRETTRDRRVNTDGGW